MSVSIIPDGSLLSVSKYMAELIVNNPEEESRPMVAKRSVLAMREMALRIADECGLREEHENVSVLGAKLATAISAQNAKSLKAAYGDLDSISGKGKEYNADDVASSDFDIPQNAQGHAYLINAFDYISHGLESDGEPETISPIIENMRKVSGHILHAHSAKDIAPFTPADLSESLTRMLNNGSDMMGAEDGLRGLIARLSVDTRHGWYTGQDMFMHMFANAYDNEKSITLPHPDDHYESVVPRVILNSVSALAPNRYALSGDIPQPDNADLQRITLAANKVASHISSLDTSNIKRLTGVPFTLSEHKSLFDDVVAFKVDMTLSGQQSLLVYDATRSFAEAAELHERYVKRDKMAYIVGDINPNELGEVKMRPGMDEKQGVLLRLLSQKNVYLMSGQGEVDKLGQAYTDSMMALPVSNADLDMLKYALIRPVDATTLNLIDILETVESEFNVFSNPTSTENTLKHVESALKGNGYDAIHPLMEKMKEVLNDYGGSTPEHLVRGAYAKLDDNAKKELNTPSSASLGATLDKLEEEGVTMKGPTR